VLQNSAVRAQLVSGGQLPGDQADAKKLRKCLLRNAESSASTNAADEEDDTVAEVNNNNNNSSNNNPANIAPVAVCQRDFRDAGGH